MRVLIAPDSFKECLPAAKVAEALAEGVLEACPEAVLDICPMADGGEGTVAAMVAATGGRFFGADVFDPLGAPIRARFAMLGQGGDVALPGRLALDAAQAVAHGEQLAEELRSTAVIEMAAASGLALVPPQRRDPLRTTTFGTGQLILAALDAGAEKIILGIGGSATVDGGCGCAQALGVRFIDVHGGAAVWGLGGGALGRIERIDIEQLDPRVSAAQIRVACDVTNPLTGPTGAASVYGPQKGATGEMVQQLEAGLAHLAGVIRRDLDIDIEHLPGAGAAGGLGGGLVAFAGASLESGIELIAQAVALQRRLAAADLCITGEGMLDAQSRSGKVAVGVARAARRAEVPVVCIPGQVKQGAATDVFAEVRPLMAGGVTLREAMMRTGELLRSRAAEVAATYVRGG